MYRVQNVSIPEPQKYAKQSYFWFFSGIFGHDVAYLNLGIALEMMFGSYLGLLWVVTWGDMGFVKHRIVDISVSVAPFCRFTAKR